MPRHLLLAVMAVLLTWSPLTANDNLQIVKLNVTPAGPPDPLLRYRFSAPARELAEGNAVPFYYRALLKLGEIPYEKRGEAEISDLLDLPLAEIPIEQARRLLALHQRTLEEAYRATRSRDVVWGPHLTNAGINTEISEIQYARTLGRIMALDARLAILSEDYTKASQIIGSMYSMSRHFANSSTLIGLLVGIAIESLASQSVEVWISQDGSPNAYWALTSLPTSVGDLAAALEAEILLIQGSFPRSERLGQVVLPAQEIDRLTTDLAAVISVSSREIQLSQLPIVLDKDNDLIARISESMLLLPAVLRAYPVSKQQLLASGMDPQLIDAMHPLQVITLRWIQVCYDFIDEMALWANHAPVEARPAMKQIARQARQWKHRPEAFLAEELFPGGLGVILDAKLRSDRRLAVLRVIEAIRLYAATHGGNLPATLADITEVPVPLDPVSSRPFAYRLEGQTAILSPADQELTNTVQFEISVRP